MLTVVLRDRPPRRSGGNGVWISSIHRFEGFRRCRYWRKIYLLPIHIIISRISCCGNSAVRLTLYFTNIVVVYTLQRDFVPCGPGYHTCEGRVPSANPDGGCRRM